MIVPHTTEKSEKKNKKKEKLKFRLKVFIGIKRYHSVDIRTRLKAIRKFFK